MPPFREAPQPTQAGFRPPTAPTMGQTEQIKTGVALPPDVPADHWAKSFIQECLEKELILRGIPFESQKDLQLSYKGVRLAQAYKPDFLCYGKIIVELKVVKEIAAEHRAQVFNYLKASGTRLGLLVNFGHYPRATVERIIL